MDALTGQSQLIKWSLVLIKILWTFIKCKVQNDFAQKNPKPAFFFYQIYNQDVGPWKLKWAPKFQNLGAHLAPKIFKKVSPLAQGVGKHNNRNAK